MRRAKVLSDQEIKRVLAVAANSGQWSARNRCLFLLSLRAGLRAGEIAALHISDVLDENHRVLDRIMLKSEQTKGQRGRVVFLSEKLRKELKAYLNRVSYRDTDRALFVSQKGRRAFTAHGMVMLLKRIYQTAGVSGASSHSGRRSFLTRLASKGIAARVLQELAGHKHLGTTQRYSDVNYDMLKKAVEVF